MKKNRFAQKGFGLLFLLFSSLDLWKDIVLSSFAP